MSRRGSLVNPAERIPVKPPETKLNRHVVVCNWNSSGPLLVRQVKAAVFTEKRSIVVVTEHMESLSICDLASDPSEYAGITGISGSPTLEANLRRADIDTAGSVLILADQESDSRRGETAGINASDAQSIVIALTLHHINPDVWICSELAEERNREHLLRAHVSEIVSTGHMGAKLIAQALLTPGLTMLFGEMLANTPQTSEPYHVPVPPALEGSSMRDVQRWAIGQRIVPVAYADRFGLIVNPSDDVVVGPGGRMVVLALDQSQATAGVAALVASMGGDATASW